MTDQNSQFFAILTAVGEAKQANANALGVPWTFAQMGVGDANNTEPVPSRTQTRLINERRRAPLNQLTIDPKDASIIIAEQVIPPDVGGWWIREIGLYDSAGDLVAVANCAPSYKPLLAQGTGKTQVVRLNLVVSSSANVQLKIDPAVVLATRDYIETVIMTVLPPTRPAGTYSKVQVNDRGVVIGGENPTTLAGYGIVDGLKKGYLGLGGKTAAASEIDRVGLEGGFHSFTSGTTSFGNWLSLLNFPYTTDDYAAQLGFQYGSDEPKVLVRSAKTSGQWGNTRTLWHDGNFRPSEYIRVSDGYLRAQVDGLLAGKANKATTLAGYGITDTFNSTELHSTFASKADKATTLSGYGITDTFTATELLAKFGNKADKATTLAGYGITDALRVNSNYVSQQVPILAAPSAGLTAADTAIVIREAQQVGAAQAGDEYAPGMAFFWSARRSGRLIMDALGALKWNGIPLLTGSVATQAEVDQGVSDTAVVTPKKLRWGFDFIKGGGYGSSAIIFPSWLGGLMIQWGVHAANSVDTETNVSFPLGFSIIPACVSTFTHDAAVVNSTVGTQMRLLTATGFQSRREDIINVSTYPAGTAYIRWVAIGY